LIFHLQLNDGLRMTESYRHCGDVSLTLDGRSLLPHLNGQAGHEEVISECMAEATNTLLFMNWDHQPMMAASAQSMRNHIGRDDLVRRVRFPKP
jgi:hypothetical protein